jgi:hypothetical protein
MPANEHNEERRHRVGDERRHHVGVEIEEFLDLLMIDPEQYVPAVKPADVDEHDGNRR